MVNDGQHHSRLTYVAFMRLHSIHKIGLQRRPLTDTAVGSAED